MKGHYYKPHCKCPGLQKKKCKCGAKWAFMLDLGKKPDGSRNQKKRGGFDTKDDAEAAAVILMEQFKTDTLPEDVARREQEKKQEDERANTLFVDLAEQWYAHYAMTGKKKKKNTLRKRINEKRILIECMGNRVARDITALEYQVILSKLKAGDEENEKPPLAYSTLVGVHATCNMIFKFGLEIGLVDVNPAPKVHVPAEYQTVEDVEAWEDIPDYLERDELITFLDTALLHGLELDYEVFMTLSYMGMRVGELCALQEPVFRPALHRLKIIKNLANPNNNYATYEIDTPKTTSSIRDNETDPDIEDILLWLIEKNKQIKEKNPNHHDKGFIFAKQSNPYIGYPLIPNNVNRRMKRLLEIANLNTELSTHSLRHTFTSLMAEAGVGLEQIMEMLGHADDEITKKIYLHTTKSKKKEAVVKFRELLKKPTQNEANVTQMLPETNNDGKIVDISRLYYT